MPLMLRVSEISPSLGSIDDEGNSRNCRFWKPARSKADCLLSGVLALMSSCSDKLRRETLEDEQLTSIEFVMFRPIVKAGVVNWKKSNV